VIGYILDFKDGSVFLCRSPLVYRRDGLAFVKKWCNSHYHVKCVQMQLVQLEFKDIQFLEKTTKWEMFCFLILGIPMKNNEVSTYFVLLRLSGQIHHSIFCG
jgi:hypothetical protein